ncbi:ExbD/TolR family protein [Hufsiella ginkgonis]|uniref:Biopolymer transporter ExbD n=1 Tax=Hufsiella ginkgonis TaxID=2695274 RepID=A0A7K1XXZ3_9SPHI|nr:biopolymer transporter ExbD [Hufsiella ginkgonis]MXV15698.1 biopolymer transporter ExbD [Hufsiella ginkgonis]
MAELTTSSAGRGSHGRTLSKTLPRVDLTAMVDLAFLLITFFMLTTTLAKQNAMAVTMPADDTEPDRPVPEKRTLNIFMGNNDRVAWYVGSPENHTPLQHTRYSGNGLRKIMLSQGAAIRQSTGKDMIVLIKPGEKSKVKNLVDVLDEINITKISRYAIVDAAPAEKKMLAGL